MSMQKFKNMHTHAHIQLLGVITLIYWPNVDISFSVLMGTAYFKINRLGINRG